MADNLKLKVIAEGVGDEHQLEFLRENKCDIIQGYLFSPPVPAEKFFDIKCRIGGLNPAASVLVVTKRAFSLHGIENICKHVENIRKYKVPVIISINRFADDTAEELKEIKKACIDNNMEAIITDYRESGGKGGTELAEKVLDLCKKAKKIKFIYNKETTG